MKQHLHDLASVTGVTAFATMISVSEVEMALRLVSLILAIIYTAYKLHKAIDED